MTGEKTAPEILTLADAARMLHVSDTTLYRLRRSGRLKTIKIGRRVFVKQSDLADMLAGFEVAHAQ